jgi:hypothetical protein
VVVGSNTATEPKGDEMLARIVRWEGGDPETVKKSGAEIREQAEEAGGPPAGVPATEFMLFHNSAGNAMAITFFENEDDYAEGDATLSSMDPPGEGMGRRTGVDKYEVAARFTA